MTEAAANRSNTSRGLFFGAGLLLVACALVYNEFSLAFLDDNPPLAEPTVAKIRTAQLSFLLTGLALVALSEAMRRIAWLESVVTKPLVTNALLSSFFIILPGFLLEVALGPFAAIHEKNITTVFAPDDELGWKHRAKSE